MNVKTWRGLERVEPEKIATKRVALTDEEIIYICLLAKHQKDTLKGVLTESIHLDTLESIERKMSNLLPPE